MPRVPSCEPYESVSGLFISWEDIATAEKAIKEQLSELKSTVEHYYNYSIEVWEIPSQKPYKALDRRLSKFIDDNDGSKRLLIVFYRGHAIKDGEALIFKRHNNDDDSPGLCWKAIQYKLLVDIEADVLLILDCCYAYSAINPRDRGVDACFESLGAVRLLASAGDDEEALLDGEYTFTKNLIAQFERSYAAPISVPSFWNELEKRAHNWRERFRQAGETESIKSLKTPLVRTVSEDHISRQMWLMRVEKRSNANTSTNDGSTSPLEEPRIPKTGSHVPEPISTGTYPNFEDNILVHKVGESQKTSAEHWIQRQHMLEQLLDGEIHASGDLRLINVAVLTSNVDMSRPVMKGALSTKRLTVKDFTGAVEEGEFSRAATHGISLILRMASFAQVFVAKVISGPTVREGDFVQIVAALDHSINTWDVDLIVIPFGFIHPVKSIRHAIERAISKGKVVIAASGTVAGGSPKKAFPAYLSSVIDISSTDALGNPSPFNPMENIRSHEQLNFATLGEGVPGLDTTDEDQMSGTSVAAHVAAALLCNALKYTSCFIIPEFGSSAHYEETKIGYRGAMALLKLMSEKRKDFDYIAPWFLWNREQDSVITRALIKRALEMA